MKPAIRVENLSKQYRIGTAKGGPTRNLTESIVDSASNLWRGLTGQARGTDGKDEFWALKDVSFDVQPGEVVGIIGRNGAGKSTLLKILSRIAEPTSGRAIVRGRLASLLEVGTGFHPELTGRENIFLNGSILGMSRQELSRKFNDIVAFAELEQFIDTPVKRYSSGMYVRLAFAVAAHLEPEVLLVDEVLAVGDAAFQKRCLGTMREAARGGRTTLFVSHQMGAISSLCREVIWVSQGRVKDIGKPDSLIPRYLRAGGENDFTGFRDLRGVADRSGDQKVRFVEARLTNSAGETTGKFGVGERIEIDLSLESEVSVSGEVGYTVRTLEGIDLFTSSSNDGGELLHIARGPLAVRATIDPNYLRPGQYSIQVGTTALVSRDVIPEAILFEIVADRHVSHGGLYNLPGCVHFPYRWELVHGVKVDAD